MAKVRPIPVPSFCRHIPGLPAPYRKVDRPPSPAIGREALAFGPATLPQQILNGIGQSPGRAGLKDGIVVLLPEMHPGDCPGRTIISEYSLLLDLLPDVILRGKSFLARKRFREPNIAILHKILDLRF